MSHIGIELMQSLSNPALDNLWVELFGEGSGSTAVVEVLSNLVTQEVSSSVDGITAADDWTVLKPVPEFNRSNPERPISVLLEKLLAEGKIREVTAALSVDSDTQQQYLAADVLIPNSWVPVPIMLWLESISGATDEDLLALMDVVGTLNKQQAASE